MHTIESLVAKFPWTNHPAILKYVDQFTPKQWELINDSALKERIDELLADEDLLNTIFDSILAVMQSEAHAHIPQDANLFNAVILLLIRDFTHPDSDYQKFKKVRSWFGDLFPVIKTHCDANLNSADEMHLITGLFSEQSITDCLEGKTKNIEPFNGEDARQYLRDNRITVAELIAYAEQAFEINDRQLPAWVSSNFVVKKAALEFTDQQLLWLSDCLSPSFLQDISLKSQLLNLFLKKTVVNGEQIIARFNHQWNFKQVAIELETFLLGAFFENEQLMINAPNKNKMNPSEKNGFIKKYGIAEPLHPEQIQAALEEAIRRAFEQGNYREAVHAIKCNDDININAIGEDGRSFLHIAAELANLTQNTLGYELLLQHPNVDTSIKNRQGKTANECLIYRVFANPKIRKQQTFRARLAAINYNGEIDPSFICPIGLVIMNDPVALSTGFAYCREALHQMLLAEIDPQTGEVPSSLNCPNSRRAFLSVEIGNPTNNNLKQLIDKFVTSQEQAYKQTLHQRISRSSSFGSFFDEKPAKSASEGAIQESNIQVI
ncbi:MAG: hypothetical protein Q8M03_02170 [Legionella sp.]|nr:hypothetical protein [Legionella sp.]